VFLAGRAGASPAAIPAYIGFNDDTVGVQTATHYGAVDVIARTTVAAANSPTAPTGVLGSNIIITDTDLKLSSADVPVTTRPVNAFLCYETFAGAP
jgi:hypothetical protein